ncbi:MAG: acetate--CoA ligase family protein [bacterium]
MNKELDKIMRPKSIAVIGASSKQGSIGHEIFQKLVNYKFAGDLYPINPKVDSICSVKAYKNILDVPGQIDLAVIVVSSNSVFQVIDECHQKGIKGLVIITAGFKETGSDGAKLEQELLAKIKKYGMRAVGPNCVGIINTEPDVHMDATFAEAYPISGKTAFVSQSGALGCAILNISKDMNVGISQFVSIGNKADINGETLLEYWEDDKDVNQILLYLESIAEPANFRKIASRITKKKPIIAVKSGRSQAGAKAASSHTGALAGADLAADALLKQSGIIRVTSILELFEVAQIFVNCPIPKGNKIAIMTNAGGPGIMATDSLCEYGLEIAQLSEKTTKILKENLSPQASVRNPVDMIASASIDQYKLTLETLLDEKNVDIIMVIYLPLMGLNPMDVAKAIMQIKEKRPKKPIIGVFMAKNGFFNEINKIDTNIPFYQYPESAAAAISKLDAQRRWIEQPVGKNPEFKVDFNKTKQIFENVIKEKRDQLTTLESIDVLKAYGIRTCKYAFAANIDESINVANEIGYPVVMKITSTKISHKTEIGGVIVNIKNDEELRQVYSELLRRLKDNNLENAFGGVIIQEMIEGSREIVCGIASDPQYGHMTMFGLGGVYVETIKDVAFKINPLTDLDAEKIVKSVKAYKLLKGVRGEPSANIEQIQETLLRLSQLVKDFNFIEELDINPLKISDKTSEGIAVDGRIKIKLKEAQELLNCDFLSKVCCCSE